MVPDVSENTTLSFQLVVINSNGIPSSPSSVVITVIVLSSSHHLPNKVMTLLQIQTSTASTMIYLAIIIHPLQTLISIVSTIIAITHT